MRKSIHPALRETPCNIDILAFDVTQLSQALDKSVKDRITRSRDRHHNSDERPLGRNLCAGAEGTAGCRAAEQCDEVAPPHSVSFSRISKHRSRYH
jgi:hypothetical protein